MIYTIEEIYLLVGKDDRVSVVTFKDGSDAQKKYGSSITVVFSYTQFDREEMDKMVLTEPFSNHGQVKARILNSELSKETEELLSIEGIYSEDISDIFYSNTASDNTFHSTNKRELNKVKISLDILPNGRDLNWMYGFSKREVKEGIGLCPKEYAFYLAGKLYFEPEYLTEEEKGLTHDENGKLMEAVEWEFLQMKLMSENITDNEKHRLRESYERRKKESMQILDNYLKQAGSSLKKLAKDNIDQAVKLSVSVLRFNERRINVLGMHPIYINIDSYLHIYMRHVEEFKVNSHFEHKDNFLWKEEDVFRVMRNVIEEVNSEYQQFRENKPMQRFSKYGRSSPYYQGDYYTFHIEPNGRISTFHRNKKEFEKA